MDATNKIIGEQRPLVEPSDIEILPTDGIIVEEHLDRHSRNLFVVHYFLAGIAQW